MGKYLKVVAIFLMVIFIGCAPKPIVRKQLPVYEYEKLQPYHVDLSQIQKPTPIINKIWLVKKSCEKSLKTGTVVCKYESVETIEEAEFIALPPEEYAKVAALVKLAGTYKDIIKQEEVIINGHIETINLLKKNINIERSIAQEYADLYVDAINNYNREQYERRRDNMLNDIKSYLVLIAIIAIGAAAL